MSIQKSCYFSISPIGGDEIHVTFIKHGTSFILKVILCPRLWSTILGDPDLELSRDWAHSSQFCVLVKRLMVCLKHTTGLCNFLVIRYYRDHLEQILHFTGGETKPRDIRLSAQFCRMFRVWLRTWTPTSCLQAWYPSHCILDSQQ